MLTRLRVLSQFPKLRAPRNALPLRESVSHFHAGASLKGGNGCDYRVDPAHRLHSASSHPTLRKWQAANADIQAHHMMYPIFVTDNPDAKEEIPSLPGQYRWGVNRIDECIEPLVKKGLSSVLLFGVVEDGKKDEIGSFGADDASPVNQTLRRLKERYPSLFLATDVCLCGYTNHGHCGVINFNDHSIINDQSIEQISKLASSFAANGADMVAPSDMMDGRIKAIKDALCRDGKDGKVSVMSYAAKFASAFYGPFRDAACSGMSFGDRKGYQLDVGARELAMRALIRDDAEGADVLMVKPGMPFLDIVRDAKNNFHQPIAVYQVSGEYAMLYHAAQADAFTLEEGVMESLVCARRAGSDVIISYFTPNVLHWLSK